MIVTAYQLEFDEYKSVNVQLHMMRSFNGVARWAIQESGFAFGKDGNWTYEPLPSSRDDKYYNSYRFSSVKEALKAWFTRNGHSAYLKLGEQVEYRLKKEDIPDEFKW